MSRTRPARAPLSTWLSVTGSLTAHLSRAWGAVSVCLLSQRRGRPTPAERRAIALPQGQPALVREVLLCGPAGQAVQARSLCAWTASRGAWRALRGLSTQPLAALLYARTDIHRGPLCARRLSMRSPERQALRRVAGGDRLRTRAVWRRESVFERRGQRLLVAECFPNVSEFCWRWRRQP